MDLGISHYEFVLVSDVLKEYYDMRKHSKILITVKYVYVW